MTAAKLYGTGYGRPPLAHQFKPGQSGNPSGRQKGSKGMSAVVAAAMNEKVSIVVNGKRRKITKWDAACMQMANQAAAGNLKAAKQMVDILHQTETRDDAKTAGSPLAAEERQAIDTMMLAAIRDTLVGIVPEVANDVGE